MPIVSGFFISTTTIIIPRAEIQCSMRNAAYQRVSKFGYFAMVASGVRS
jgi:hypothetical protein